MSYQSPHHYHVYINVHVDDVFEYASFRLPNPRDRRRAARWLSDYLAERLETDLPDIMHAADINIIEED